MGKNPVTTLNETCKKCLEPEYFKRGNSNQAKFLLIIDIMLSTQINLMLRLLLGFAHIYKEAAWIWEEFPCLNASSFTVGWIH